MHELPAVTSKRVDVSLSRTTSHLLRHLGSGLVETTSITAEKRPKRLHRCTGWCLGWWWLAMMAWTWPHMQTRGVCAGDHIPLAEGFDLYRQVMPFGSCVLAARFPGVDSMVDGWWPGTCMESNRQPRTWLPMGTGIACSIGSAVFRI